MAPNPTYDTLPDDLLAALGIVCGRRINAGLDLHGADAIKKVYLFPLDLRLIPSVQTPALAIYRLQSAYLPHGTKTWWRETMRFDYFAPKTSHTKLGQRWPLLHQVRLELLDALCDGTVDGVPHFINAGIQHINRTDFVVNYTYAQNDSFAWPVSQASVLIDWEEQKVETLLAATELFAQQNRDDQTEFIVTSLHTLPP